ncbi:uncharacterized protein LOC135844023 isoform X2 [Planococcus citri]
MKKILLITSFLSLQKISTSESSPNTTHYDTDDFKTLLLNYPNQFVDKSLLIQEYLQLINENISTLIILRPEGWGKSTNIKMLQNFLQVEVDEKGHPLLTEHTTNDKLFLGGEITSGLGNHNNLSPLKISNFPNATQHLGKHPTILLQLKNATGNTYEQIELGIKSCVMEVYKNHEYLIHSTKITKKEQFKSYLLGEITKTELISSIHFLSEKLYEHFDQKVHILIDDYDIPFINAFINYCTADYRKVGKLLGSIYEKSSRENSYQKITLYTGVFPIETNVQVYYKEEHLIQPPFSEFFGFTRDEVKELLEKSSITIDPEQLETWYGGYNVGGKKNHYNCRSVIRFLVHKGVLDYYGPAVKIDPHIKNLYPSKKVDIAQNSYHESNSISVPSIMAECMMIKKTQSSYRIPILFLLNGHCIRSNDEHEAHSFGRIQALDYRWSSNNFLLRDILFYSGYLTTNAIPSQQKNIKYFHLSIPNNETKHFYQIKALQWLCHTLQIDADELHSFVHLLSTAKITEFLKTLQNFIRKPSVRQTFDSGAQSELYHSFLISLKHVLSTTHTTGYENDGQLEKTYVLQDHLHTVEYEVIFIPQLDQSDTAIILRYELEYIGVLNSTAETGLKRVQELSKRIDTKTLSHLKKIIKISLAFYYEDMESRYKIDNISS